MALTGEHFDIWVLKQPQVWFLSRVHFVTQKLKQHGHHTQKREGELHVELILPVKEGGFCCLSSQESWGMLISWGLPTPMFYLWFWRAVKLQWNQEKKKSAKPQNRNTPAPASWTGGVDLIERGLSGAGTDLSFSSLSGVQELRINVIIWALNFSILLFPWINAC